MKDDFDRVAMEEKIRKNLEAGWSLDGIRRALIEEELTLLNKMKTLEERVIQLSDQLEYLERYYVKSS